jgi:hypothetical protein
MQPRLQLSLLVDEKSGVCELLAQDVATEKFAVVLQCRLAQLACEMVRD